MFINRILLEKTSEYIITGIVAGIITLLFLGGIVILLVFEYRRKKKVHAREMVETKIRFEQELMTARLEVQEHILNSISQDIHDNVGQTLSLTKVQLNIIGEQGIFNRPMLEEAKDNVSLAISDLRDIAKNLSSEWIKAMGLCEAIEQERQRIVRSGIMDITFGISGNSRPLTSSREIMLFRIIQECLQNIIKHSEARSTTISFDYLDKDLQVTVTDNGKGFDPETARFHNNGLGLNNIYNRTSLIGGNALIKSIPSAGTTIKLHIPYESNS